MYSFCGLLDDDDVYFTDWLMFWRKIPKLRNQPTRLHCVTTQKSPIRIFIALKSSNLISAMAVVRGSRWGGRHWASTEQKWNPQVLLQRSLP
jgi:hypothetical protein